MLRIKDLRKAGASLERQCLFEQWTRASPIYFLSTFLKQSLKGSGMKLALIKLCLCVC